MRERLDRPATGSRARFAGAVAVAAVATAVAAFALTASLLDDGPSTAPSGARAASSDSTSPGPTAAGGAATSTTAPATLVTPAWVVVVSSERSRPEAEAVAERVRARGHQAGVVRSDDHASLSPGFWVAYAGPVADQAAGEAELAALGEDGIDGGYVRCVGSVAECGPPPG